MKIYEVTDKRKYLPLLLIADEQEDMVYRYLDRGVMYVLDDAGIKAEIVICDEGQGVIEIKNIAVSEGNRKKGYGKALINFICEKYKGRFSVVRVGTGESPLTLPFYEKCGFVKSHKVKNFFTDNYAHPIYEGGVLLKDMIYLTKQL